MNRDEHLLSIASEECNELAQRLIKAMRFGIDQVQPESHTEGTTDTSSNPEQLNNRERIEREYSHLVAAMRMLGINYDVQQTNAKVQKVERYLQICEGYGTLAHNTTGSAGGGASTQTRD
jgi:hypothetical protein